MQDHDAAALRCGQSGERHRSARHGAVHPAAVARPRLTPCSGRPTRPWTPPRPGSMLPSPVPRRLPNRRLLDRPRQQGRPEERLRLGTPSGRASTEPPSTSTSRRSPASSPRSPWWSASSPPCSPSYCRSRLPLQVVSLVAAAHGHRPRPAGQQGLPGDLHLEGFLALTMGMDALGVVVGGAGLRGGEGRGRGPGSDRRRVWPRRSRSGSPGGRRCRLPGARRCGHTEGPVRRVVAVGGRALGTGNLYGGHQQPGQVGAGADGSSTSGAGGEIGAGTRR